MKINMHKQVAIELNMPIIRFYETTRKNEEQYPFVVCFFFVFFRSFEINKHARNRALGGPPRIRWNQPMVHSHVVIKKARHVLEFLYQMAMGQFGILMVSKRGAHSIRKETWFVNDKTKQQKYIYINIYRIKM